MQATFRAEIPIYHTAVESIQARLEKQSFTDDIPQMVFPTDIGNIIYNIFEVPLVKVDSVPNLSPNGFLFSAFRYTVEASTLVTGNS